MEQRNNGRKSCGNILLRQIISIDMEDWKDFNEYEEEGRDREGEREKDCFADDKEKCIARFGC